MAVEISAAKFKAQCLKLMDDVQTTRSEIVITKRGRPVAKLVPYEEKPKSLFGYMKGTVIYHGDVVEPIDVEWEANE